MPLDQAFNAIASSMSSAAAQQRIDAAEAAAELHGLVRQSSGPASQITIWERIDQGRTLRFKWRYYDQSQAFSIRPDMNILTLELCDGDRVLRQAEERYED